MMARSRLLFSIFLIGFAALIYQIYSVQVLFMFFIHNSHAVALTISSFLAGLAFSGLLFSRITKNKDKYLSIVFYMQLAAALYGYVVLRDLDLIPLLLDSISNTVPAGITQNILKLGLIWLFLLIPAIFVGGALPLINGLYVSDLSDTGRDTGTVYFWDTFGAILGALVAGFWLLPEWGVERTILIPVCINLVVCTLCAPTIWLRITILCLLIIPLSDTIDAEKEQATLPSPISAHETPLYAEFTKEDVDLRFGKILFREESPFGKITVGQVSPNDKTLFVNYRDMCTTAGIEDGSETELSRILAANAPKGGNALNIGMGCGFTAKALSDAGDFKLLHIVEINPTIYAAARSQFRQENGGVLERANTKVSIEDGAAYLRRSAAIYDSIAIDVEEVNVIYSSPLYTQEYFTIAEAKLSPEGIIGVWSFSVNTDFAKVLYNTLGSVFTHVAYLPQATGDLFFGSNSPLTIPALQDAKLIQKHREVMESTNNEINMLSKMALEKYYNMHTIFSLPEDYREPYLINIAE